MVNGESDPRRVSILGVEVSAVALDGAIEIIRSWITERRRHFVCVTGVHGVMESQRDAELTAIHNDSGLTVPDGMPLVWSARFAGARSVGHVRGADLMMRLLEEARAEGWSSFFYGGGPGVPELLVAQLEEQLPGLRVAGAYAPPFRPLSPDEEAEIRSRINDSGADIVWVGLSTPKQERWMARQRDHLQAPVLLGVGAAFDFHAGLKKQAPTWAHNTGFEWLYRLIQEPRRLARRYLRNNPEFVYRLLRHPPRLVTRSRTTA